MLTLAQLRNALDYDAETGIFTWKENRGTVKKGDRSGMIRKDTGKRSITINGHQYMERDLSYFYQNGEWLQSNRHQTGYLVTKRKYSGTPGVSYYAPSKSWRAQITVNKKTITIYYSKHRHACNIAYQVAKIKFHE